MPTVMIPTPFRGTTRNVAEVEVAPGTLLDCLKQVGADNPGFFELVIDGEGRVHRWIKLYINKEQVEGDGTTELALAEGDRLEVLAAVAGG
jgi:sulfur carrier protein ThiS